MAAVCPIVAMNVLTEKKGQTEYGKMTKFCYICKKDYQKSEKNV